MCSSGMGDGGNNISPEGLPFLRSLRARGKWGCFFGQWSQRYMRRACSANIPPVDHPAKKNKEGDVQFRETTLWHVIYWNVPKSIKTHDETT